MAVYKRGAVWWYTFVFKGERIQASSKQGNKRVAEQIEAAHKTQLAKGEVGIQERKAVPLLRDFAPRFADAIEMNSAEKPRTVDFYKAKLRTLLADDVLAGTRLDRIDEAAIEQYKQGRSRVKSRRKRPLSPGSINRELATLRRLLRLAHEWKVIQRVPRVHMLKGEKHREAVLSRPQEQLYFAVAPQPLSDVALLLLDTGLRIGEALSLEWPQVKLKPAPGAKFGYATVLSGKAKNSRSRNVPLSERAVEMLKRWDPCDTGLVFKHSGGKALTATVLDQQHARMRTLLKLPSEFVLHSLRHTFGSRLGEVGTDAFTIMKLMGHSSVTVSQRYVHPSPEALELAYERMTALNLQVVSTLSATLSDVATGVPQ